MQRSHREVGALMHQERVHSEVGNGAIKDDDEKACSIELHLES